MLIGAYNPCCGQFVSLGFAEVIAVVASCSALAAIMSTADSCIIGANNVITVDWVKNHLWKSASDKQVHRFSKVCHKLFVKSFSIAVLPFSDVEVHYRG